MKTVKKVYIVAFLSLVSYVIFILGVISTTDNIGHIVEIVIGGSVYFGLNLGLILSIYSIVTKEKK